MTTCRRNQAVKLRRDTTGLGEWYIINVLVAILPKDVFQETVSQCLCHLWCSMLRRRTLMLWRCDKRMRRASGGSGPTRTSTRRCRSWRRPSSRSGSIGTTPLPSWDRTRHTGSLQTLLPYQPGRSPPTLAIVCQMLGIPLKRTNAETQSN